MTDEIRRNMVIQAINEAQFANPGGNINETYEGTIKHIHNNQSINEKEKEEAIRLITVTKDRENFFRLKEETYPCDICSKAGFTILNCEHCVRDTLQKNFNSWTSGNDIIDNAIKQAQLNCPIPRYISEWIKYEDFEDVEYLTEGGCAKIWTATWKKGFIQSYDKEQRQFIRSGPFRVVLKQLANSKKAIDEFLKEVILSISNDIAIVTIKIKNIFIIFVVDTSYLAEIKRL